MEKIKSIMLLSGGMDSTVSYYWALRNTDIQKVVFFNFGQRNWMWERKAVHDLVARHIIQEVILPNLWHQSRKPARNMVLISAATAIAGMLDASAIVGGWSGVDYDEYPDCRPTFLKAMSIAASAALDRDVKVLDPVLELSKDQIVELGDMINVPWELTRSCYTAQEQPCGECAACKYRREAFKHHGKDIP